MDVVLATCKKLWLLEDLFHLYRRNVEVFISLTVKCMISRQTNDEIRDAALPDRCFRCRWTAGWGLRGLVVTSVSNPEMSNHESQG